MGMWIVLALLIGIIADAGTTQLVVASKGLVPMPTSLATASAKLDIGCDSICVAVVILCSLLGCYAAAHVVMDFRKLARYVCTVLDGKRAVAINAATQTERVDSRTHCVWISAAGDKYHVRSNCAGLNAANRAGIQKRDLCLNCSRERLD